MQIPSLPPDYFIDQELQRLMYRPRSSGGDSLSVANYLLVPTAIIEDASDMAAYQVTILVLTSPANSKSVLLPVQNIEGFSAEANCAVACTYSDCPKAKKRVIEILRWLIERTSLPQKRWVEHIGWYDEQMFFPHPNGAGVDEERYAVAPNIANGKFLPVSLSVNEAFRCLNEHFGLSERDVQYEKVVTFGVTLAAVMKSRLQSIKISTDFVLLIVGESGAGKTRLATTLCTIYDPQTIPQKFEAASSYACVREKMTQLRDSPVILDDVAATSIGRLDTERIERLARLIRLASNGATEGKGTGLTAHAYKSTGVLVVTSEHELTAESDLARCILLPMPSGERQDKYTPPELHMMVGSLIQYFLNWVGENGKELDSAAQRIKSWIGDLPATHQQSRIEQHFLAVAVAYEVFYRFLDESCKDTQAVHLAHDQTLAAVRKVQDTQCNWMLRRFHPTAEMLVQAVVGRILRNETKVVRLNGQYRSVSYPAEIVVFRKECVAISSKVFLESAGEAGITLSDKRLKRILEAEPAQALVNPLNTMINGCRRYRVSWSFWKRCGGPL